MKDRAFSGRDVAEAIRSAAQALGLPESRLRYFVLDPGRPGSLGVAPSPATIAVLMDAPSSGPPPPARSPSPVRPAAPVREGGEPRQESPFEEDELEGEPEPLGDRLARVVQALHAALDLGVSGEVAEDREATTLRLTLSEPAFLLGPEGEGAPARALEHLLHRMFAHEVAPRKLRVELTGFRDAREESLKELTLRLVAEVRQERTPRETPPMNAYERRLVHMTAAIAGGVTTQSEGEGAERRVILRPAADTGLGGEVF